MDAPGFQIPQCLVHQAVPCEGGESDELPRANMEMEMPAFGSAGMTGVQGAVVTNLEGVRLECEG